MPVIFFLRKWCQIKGFTEPQGCWWNKKIRDWDSRQSCEACLPCKGGIDWLFREKSRWWKIFVASLMWQRLFSLAHLCLVEPFRERPCLRRAVLPHNWFKIHEKKSNFLRRKSLDVSLTRSADLAGYDRNWAKKKSSGIWNPVWNLIFLPRWKVEVTS